MHGNDRLQRPERPGELAHVGVELDAHAAQRVLLDAQAFRIAKEHQHRIADELVDVSPVGKDDAGLDSTAVVLDSVKSTYNGVNIRPWIKGGVAGKKYRSFCKVTTNAGVIGVFIVAFDMLSNT